LLGDNGSGKTTVLQAIALALSLATRRTDEVGSFAWHGFLPERLSSLGNTRVELEIVFGQEELEATVQALATAKQTSSLALPFPVSQQFDLLRAVTLRYEPHRVTVLQKPEAALQFLGRYCVRNMSDWARPKSPLLKQLGDVFWFDQFRSLGATMAGRRATNAAPAAGDTTWEAGVEQLREFLVGWWGYHTSPEKVGGKDYIPELEGYFGDLFPGTRFKGVVPRGNASDARAADFYFLLERDGKTFDIAEMSSGEQAIFPLLYEFVRLDIGRSVVLIDELELHLHPPQQQALLSALPRIGPDCQYIVTSHSPYIEQVVPDEWEVRLEGGRQCL